MSTTTEDDLIAGLKLVMDRGAFIDTALMPAEDARALGWDAPGDAPVLLCRDLKDAENAARAFGVDLLDVQVVYRRGR